MGRECPLFLKKKAVSLKKPPRSCMKKKSESSEGEGKIPRPSSRHGGHFVIGARLPTPWWRGNELGRREGAFISPGSS